MMVDKKRDLDDFKRFCLTGDPNLRHSLIERNLGLAYQLSYRLLIHSECFDYDDLRSEAVVALIIAVDQYDPDYDVCFSTFATNVILRHLRTYIHRQLYKRRRDVEWGFINSNEVLLTEFKYPDEYLSDQTMVGLILDSLSHDDKIFLCCLYGLCGYKKETGLEVARRFHKKTRQYASYRHRLLMKRLAQRFWFLKEKV